jgi:phage shock protein A
MNIDNNLEEESKMTQKVLLIFSAAVISALFSFTTFAQEPAQEAAAEGSGKTIAYSDLQEQKKKIEGLRANYAQIKSEYTAECVDKTFSAGDEGIKKCEDKYKQLTSINNELKKEVAAYSKNVEQFKASAKSSPDAIGPTSQTK